LLGEDGRCPATVHLAKAAIDAPAEGEQNRAEEREGGQKREARCRSELLLRPGLDDRCEEAAETAERVDERDAARRRRADEERCRKRPEHRLNRDESGCAQAERSEREDRVLEDAGKDDAQRGCGQRTRGDEAAL